ncbi:hypothetical protein LSCM1_07553 [Leishmania martiniquensis]|uniref:RING-type domain-containing protein n=1 Tax=Leishmania martiniquensis TaxID=1580590 RepID=A0A836H643_9TRYP|nr:hypothetical protein LSCM1_07553 [Leishmania martiniquensis]
MSFLAREFKELEATSQLPPSIPPQHVAPSTVLLPATVGKMPPQLAVMAAVARPACAGGVAVAMPQLSTSVASEWAATSPQASTLMGMAPVLGLSPFSAPLVLNGSATSQVTSDGYLGARAGRGCSMKEDPAPAPLASASSAATARLSHSTAESLRMVNNTSAHHCHPEETTSMLATDITVGSGSWQSSRSDACLNTSPSCSTLSAHFQQPCRACDAPSTCVKTHVLDPSSPSAPGVGGTAMRVGLMHHHTSSFPAFSEGAHAFPPLATVVETTRASAAAPAIPTRSASHGQLGIGRPSSVPKDGAPRQAPDQPRPMPQTPLSSTTGTASAASQTKVRVQPSMQEGVMTVVPATPRGGSGAPSSNATVAPPPSPCHYGSAANCSTNAVGEESSDGESRRGSHTSATAAETARPAAFALSRPAPSPVSPTTATPPSPPSGCLSSTARSISSRNGNGVPNYPNNSSTGRTSSAIAFVPIGVQPAFTTTAPSFFSSSACRSPAHAAVSVSEPAATSLPMAAVAPHQDRFPSFAALPTSSVPRKVDLEQPLHASGRPQEPVAPPAQPHLASLTTHPLPRPAYWSLPHAPAGAMTVILAAPEVGWHPLTEGVATTPASCAGAAISGPCDQNFLAGFDARSTGTPPLESCSSPSSIAASRAVSPSMLTSSPAPSVTLEAQRASCGRGATPMPAGQTHRNALVHGGGGVGGRGVSAAHAGVMARGSGYGLGLPLSYSQPQLLCTLVPLDDTESVCAICLEGQTSKTAMTGPAESTALSPPPMQTPRAAEESTQESDSTVGGMSDMATADDGTIDEEAEHATKRGVKPGSCLLSLPCGHCYHQNCVQRWLMESQRCPMCRRDLTRDATIN